MVGLPDGKQHRPSWQDAPKQQSVLDAHMPEGAEQLQLPFVQLLLMQCEFELQGLPAPARHLSSTQLPAQHSPFSQAAPSSPHAMQIFF